MYTKPDTDGNTLPKDESTTVTTTGDEAPPKERRKRSGVIISKTVTSELAEKREHAKKKQAEQAEEDLNASARLRSKVKEDMKLEAHIKYVALNPPPEDHKFFEQWCRVYRPDGKIYNEGEPLPDWLYPPLVTARIGGQLEMKLYKGDTPSHPLASWQNVELVVFLHPVTRTLANSVFGGRASWKKLLPPWRDGKMTAATAAYRKEVDGKRIEALVKDFWPADVRQPADKEIEEWGKYQIGLNEVNPMTDHYESLDPWDGVERLRQPFGPTVKLTTEAGLIMENALIAWVHRHFNPGCQMDSALILVGPGGNRKTTWLENYTHGIVNTSALPTIPEGSKDKDDVALMHTSPVVIIDEIDKFSLKTPGSKNGSDAKLKSLITGKWDSYRKPYGYEVEEHMRPSVFVGTTNEMQFIGDPDPTVARRYWPVVVPSRVPDECMTREWMDLLMAEALHKYRERLAQGLPPYRYDDEFEEMMRRVRLPFFAENSQTPLMELLSAADALGPWNQAAITDPGPDSDIFDIRLHNLDHLTPTALRRILLRKEGRFGDTQSVPKAKELEIALRNLDVFERIPIPTGQRPRIMVDGQLSQSRNIWRRKRDLPGQPTWGAETLSEELLAPGIAGWGFVPTADGLGTTRGWVPTEDNPNPTPKHPKFGAFAPKLSDHLSAVAKEHPLGATFGTPDPENEPWKLGPVTVPQIPEHLPSNISDVAHQRQAQEA